MADAVFLGPSDPLGTFVGDDLDLTGQPRAGLAEECLIVVDNDHDLVGGGYCWARKEGVARTSKDQRRSL